MKKIKLLWLILVVCVFCSACNGTGGNSSGEDNTDTPGKENTDTSGKENTDTSGMVWFPKSARCTSEDGTLLAAIETELDDSKLVYKYIMYSETSEKYYGFEVGYDGDKVTKYYTLYGRNGNHQKEEITIEYAASENTLYVKTYDSETGDPDYCEKYEYRFDDEGKVTERTYSFITYRHDENNQLVERVDDTPTVRKYEYVDGGYNITWENDSIKRELPNEERVACVMRHTTFIPYDLTKNHTVSVTYYLEDGTVAALAEDKDCYILCEGSGKAEYVYNSAGYLIEQYAYMADGTKKSIDLEWECQYNEAGNVQSYTEYDEEGNVRKKADYTFDDNGNISGMTIESGGEKYTAEIEWMMIPKCLDDVNRLMYGEDVYAIAELIEEAIPESDMIGLKDAYYTKDMLEDLLK